MFIWLTDYSSGVIFQVSLDVSPQAIAMFVVLMCGMLVSLYFFYDYLGKGYSHIVYERGGWGWGGMRVGEACWEGGMVMMIEEYDSMMRCKGGMVNFSYN